MHRPTQRPPPGQALFLGGNVLRGPLPAGYSALALTELYLNDNQLSGPLPPEWAAAPLARSLQELSLAYNQLSGPLPLAWADLHSLRVLKLNSNKLSGAVPPAWAPPGGMKALGTLTVFNNPDLSGCLPAGLAKRSQPVFQGLSGKRTGDVAVAARGTKVTGFCR